MYKYLNLKEIILIILILAMSNHAQAKSLWEKFKETFSFGVPSNILEKINKNIVGKVNAKKIRFFLPNKIEIEELEVLDQNGLRMLYSPKVRMAISLPSLLTNEGLLKTPEAKFQFPL